MGQILELIKLLLPFLMELIKLLKGQPSDVKLEAVNQARSAIKKACEGVGCAPNLKE